MNFSQPDTGQSKSSLLTVTCVSWFLLLDIDGGSNQKRLVQSIGEAEIHE